MKKILAVVLSCCIVLSLASTIAFAAGDDVKIIVNGDTIDFSGDQPPVIQNGRTLVPFRLVFEKMGAEVDWFPDTRLCQAVYGNKIVGIEIGSETAQLGDIDGNISIIGGDVPAQIINGRTMVPLRILSEGIGAEVNWDNDTRTVSIITPAVSDENIPDSVEYSMAGGGGSNEAGFIVSFEYPVITTDYAAADTLNELIRSNIFSAASVILDENNESAAELNLTCRINRNESQIFEVHYIDDNGDLVYSQSYSIADGTSRGDGIISFQSDISNEADAKDGEVYSIIDYRTFEKAADDTIYIESTLEYPRFTQSSEAISALNTQLYDSAKEAADAFVASHKEEALEYYNENAGSLFGVPYCFDSMASVEISEDKVAAITFSYIEETPDMETPKTSEETIVVDLTTGEIISE